MVLTGETPGGGRQGPRSQGLAGHLCKIRLENFMCHEHFEMDFGWARGAASRPASEALPAGSLLQRRSSAAPKGVEDGSPGGRACWRRPGRAAPLRAAPSAAPARAPPPCAAPPRRPHVTFVSGTNGSGKSAVLQALQICLGATARSTGRSANLSNFIRTGANEARVQVTLWNTGGRRWGLAAGAWGLGRLRLRLRCAALGQLGPACRGSLSTPRSCRRAARPPCAGEDAYQPHLLGNKITIERRLGTTNTWKLLDSRNKNVRGRAPLQRPAARALRRAC